MKHSNLAHPCATGIPLSTVTEEGVAARKILPTVAAHVRFLVAVRGSDVAVAVVLANKSGIAEDFVRTCKPTEWENDTGNSPLRVHLAPERPVAYVRAHMAVDGALAHEDARIDTGTLLKAALEVL